MDKVTADKVTEGDIIFYQGEDRLVREVLRVHQGQARFILEGQAGAVRIPAYTPVQVNGHDSRYDD